MTTPRTTVARLRQHLASLPDPHASDAQLVARFAATRDDGAFAELVRRHGPLVLAVCRRVTGNRDDADDAFQAAFLVLARKPDRVWPDSPLAGWLYGVAVRAARKAVARTARRRSRETTAELVDLPDRAPASDPDTVRAVLEEVARLSEACRAAVVLCELEGRTRAAAARELGIAEGTLSSRLAAARKVLARRFRDRGLAPAVFAAVAGSAACPVLAADAVRLSGAPAVPRVERLSEAVMKTAFPIRWAVASAAAVVISLGFALGGAEPAPVVSKPVARLQPAPNPAAKGPNKILFYRAGHLTLIDPDGKNVKDIPADPNEFHPGNAILSPDGKRFVALRSATDPKAPNVPAHKLFARKVGDEKSGADLGIGTALAGGWSPDGAEVVCYEFADAPPGAGAPEVVHSVVNVKTKEKTILKLPKYHVVTDWSRDGKYFVAGLHYIAVATSPDAGIFLVNRDGTEHKRVTDKNTRALGGKLSPDGKQLLCRVLPPLAKGPPGKAESVEFRVRVNRSGVIGSASPSPGKADLVLVDVATGKVTKVEDVPLNGDLQGYCWSPDGKKIAYAWRTVHDGKPEDVQDKETESFLVVCDADGKNAKTIVTEKGENPLLITIGCVDWR